MVPYTSSLPAGNASKSQGGGVVDKAGKSLSYLCTSYVSGTLPEPGQKGHQSLGIWGRFCLWDAIMTQSLIMGFQRSSAIVSFSLIIIRAGQTCADMDMHCAGTYSSIASFRDRLILPLSSISMILTLITSPTLTTSSTFATLCLSSLEI